MSRTLLVFIDGIGYGRPGAQNPFALAPLRILSRLGDPSHEGDPRVAYGSLDATLGHPGLPQSATGQSTLFTGEDAIAVAGGHKSGYPSRTVAELVLERSFLRRARAAGRRAGFLNAFDSARAKRMARIVSGHERAPRHRAPSASTLTALAGQGTLATFDEARAGRAATFDLTGEVCRGYGVDAPHVTLREAARAVARGAAELDVALFELFLTDKAGHSQDMTWARWEIMRTERFLSELFDAVDPAEQLVVVTSDHGNLEDLSTPSHTRARVPLLAFGHGAASFVEGAETLRDVAPRILARAGSIFGSFTDGARP